MGMDDEHHTPAALPQGKNQYPLYRRLGRPQGWSGRVRKNSPPQGFDPRVFQLLTSRCINCAIQAHKIFKYGNILSLKKGKIIVNVAYFGLTFRELGARQDGGEKIEKRAAVR